MTVENIRGTVERVDVHMDHGGVFTVPGPIGKLVAVQDSPLRIDDPQGRTLLLVAPGA